VSLNLAGPDAGVVADLDPLRIREVLTNLLSNAVRHTPTGGTVTVSVSNPSDADAVTVAVSDTGEGMTPEHLARIFDRFYKGSTSRGSGLGLAIARGIVRAHGGEITASSRVGTGTTVAFTLPRDPRR
jgi:signal transduction histidine kinase